MKFNLKLAQRLALCTAPLVTGSLFIALPGSAATLARSEAVFSIGNFSHNPVETGTFTSTDTLAISAVAEPNASGESHNAGSSEIIPSKAIVAATADAIASFPVAPLPEMTGASNLTFSQASGDGEGNTASYSYLGVAQSSAQFVGYNFNIGAGETFSFDFASAFNLYTSRDHVANEATNAFTNLTFALFDTTDLENPLDFLAFSGQLDSPATDSGSVAFNFLGYSSNGYSNIEPNEVAFNTSFGDKEKSAFGFVQGTFSRVFHKLTSVVLVAFQNNGAAVSCDARW